MKKNFKTRVVQFRRKREGKTNYKKRLKLLKSGMPRLVIKKSLKHISVQIIEYSQHGDKVVATINSKVLEKMGWPAKGNIPSAYLTGLLVGKKAVEMKIKKIILDTGMQSVVKGSRIYALAKGAIDAGMDIPHAKDVLPNDDIVKCKAIENYAKILKEKDADAYKKQFSQYLKNNIDPLMLGKMFETIKNKITGAK